jgi:ribosome assembly protein SQT1
MRIMEDQNKTTVVHDGDDDDMMMNVDGEEDHPSLGTEAAAAGLDVDDDDDIPDDTPAFIDMQDAVEVHVDDDNRPMDEDDDDDDDVEGDGGFEMKDGADADDPSSPDDSKYRMTSHTDAVYAVASAIDTQTGRLNILSGGGDDKSFLYVIPTTSPNAAPVTVQHQPIPHPFKDTVSSVVYNWQYVADPTDSKTPRLAAVGSYDGTILLYDTSVMATTSATTALQPKLQLEGPSDVEWMAFHPKGGTVLLVGSGDASVWMFHLPLNRCLQVFVGHEQAVTCGDFSPDGKWALSASSDGTLRIWAPKTGMNRHVFRFANANDGSPPAGLTCMATGGGSDAALVMVGGEDGNAHVCHIVTKKVVATLRHFDLTGMAASGNNDDQMEHPMSVEAVGFCPIQPTWCATGGVDGKLKIWDLSRDGGQLRQVCHLATTPENNGTVDSITRLKWHPTLPLVFTSHVTGVVRLWDARGGTLVHTLHGGQDQINDMDVQYSPASPNMAFIVSASDDKTVRVFELDVEAALQKAVATTA